jgi:hypothetical protein
MRILVTGSRDWADRLAVRSALYDLFEEHGTILVVHGDCPTGADLFASEWVGDNWQLGVREEKHPADWRRHGRAAGPIRNRKMVAAGADLCLAFPLGASPGTRGCMAAARAAGIPVIEPARETS